jgi:membrane-associated protein
MVIQQYGGTMEYLIDYLLHFDRHLTELAALHGGWLYTLLFLIVFAETGLIVTPFLPGDSLLFAAGALAEGGALDFTTLVLLLSAAAILGDAVNYSIGRAVGPRVFRATAAPGLRGRLLNREHLQRAHEFFERHGGKAIVLARFAPIVRTFVPFVAGAGSMAYGSFLFYNVLGGVLWVLVCAGAGYAFGHVPVAKEHFSVVALSIIGLSLVPMALELFRRSRPLPRGDLAG